MTAAPVLTRTHNNAPSAGGESKGAQAGKSGHKGAMPQGSRRRNLPINVDGTAVAAFLRRLYPVKTAACVAAYEGVPVDTFRKWQNGCAPSFAATLGLICRHGPAFLTAVLPDPPAWIDTAANAQRQALLEAEIAAKKRELEALRSSG